MRKLIFIAMLFVLGLAAEANAQDRRVADQARPDIPVTITDAAGKAMSPENLPAKDKAKLERLKAAAYDIKKNEKGIAAGEPGGGAQRINITISCTYPPLKCTIIVSW
jgi:hypothetical protein